MFLQLGNTTPSKITFRAIVRRFECHMFIAIMPQQLLSSVKTFCTFFAMKFTCLGMQIIQVLPTISKIIKKSPAVFALKQSCLVSFLVSLEQLLVQEYFITTIAAQETLAVSQSNCSANFIHPSQMYD